MGGGGRGEEKHRQQKKPFEHPMPLFVFSPHVFPSFHHPNNLLKILKPRPNGVALIIAVATVPRMPIDEETVPNILAADC